MAANSPKKTPRTSPRFSSNNKEFQSVLGEKQVRQLAKLFPEMASTFPRKISGVRVIGGRTLTRFGDWHKMAVLVDNGNSVQLRLIGWHNRNGEWKFDQKFYMTGKNMWDVLGLLQELLLHFQDGVPRRHHQTTREE